MVRAIGFILLFTSVMFGDYVIHTREGGVAYFGSNRVYVGSYTWPEGREPLGVYSPRSALVTQYDHPDVTCDPDTNTCYAKNHNLPNGTEVKFGTKGELPPPLISWEQNRSKAYYIRDSTLDTFRLAESPGGDAIDVTDRGHGKHGMSFAGYSHVVTFAARFARRATCDPDTNICTTEGPHGYSNGKSFYLVNEGGSLPSPLVPSLDSHPVKYCAVVVDTTRLQLRYAPFEAPCPTIGYGENITTVTCSAATNRCTYPPNFLIKSSLKVRFRSTETLPEPLNPDVTYLVTALNVTEQTFQIEQRLSTDNVVLKSSGSGTIMMDAVVEDFTDSGTGTQFLTYSDGFNIWIYDIQGYPQGTTFSFRGNGTVLMNPSVSSRGYGSIVGSEGTGTMIAKVPAVTPPGDYPITVTLSDSSKNWTNLKPLTYTLRAMDLTPLRKDDPASYPPIPNLEQWETLMTSSKNGGGGASGPVYPRCPSRENPAAGTGALSYASIDAKVWFYDGAANFFEISRYPGIASTVSDQPLWANCGEYIAATLRDVYLKSPAQHGWTYFPRGLYLAYQYTGDDRYKSALIAIADAGNNRRGSTNEFLMREHAYAFERHLYRYRVTGEVDHSLQYYADSALGMLLSNVYNDESRTFLQPFMAGLLARPLIDYYLLYHDERIPVVLKLFADRFWSDWYDKDTHKMLYNTEPYGARCTISCQRWLPANLNNLVAPMFAFLWRMTGDDTYRIQGDDMFGNVFKDGTPWDPKQWNQTYYWAWDFVAWRQGRKAAYSPARTVTSKPSRSR